MSGRTVAPTYRAIVDDVVTNCRADFDELGIEQAVLDALQASWEEKLLTARVADFSSDARLGPEQARLGPAPPRPSDHDVPSSSREKKPKTEKATNGSTSAAGGEGAAGADDEINSDLDDSEDEADAAEVADMEAGGGDLVIALYDKVQRVKNKWKVTLKDGVVSVEGKDYLFHKCSGEFEW